MSLDIYTIFTLLIVFTAIFSYINFRFIKLPATIGVMIISLIFSLLLVISGNLFPAISEKAAAAIESIHFEELLMEILLSFLLFAGAIHINIGKLKKQAVPIITFATAGVIISTIIVGVLMFFIFKLLHLNVDLIYCLLFGALISPTDPIAVMGILKNAKIPEALETKISGESLFNDGVGVVVFLSILEVARLGIENLSAGQIGLLFLKEAGGGLVWGWLLGYVAFYLLRSIDNYKVEVIITLAIVMGGYAFANAIHISGPLAMVVAGIMVGNKGKALAMSDITRDYVGKFWELVDEILNALLFMLIGFEMLVITYNSKLMWIGFAAVAIVLLARIISVSIPIFFLSFRRTFERNTITMLTWGGLRGGISVALALSLPKDMFREEFVTVTYIVVVFSIIVQGLTIGKVARKLVKQ
ncbi:MAG TPA: sodium:proton antiporter [Chitinophagaceae bacterium]|nr:sodium:proton antiporter [Chitinophagaceae bacterium]